MTLQEQYDQIEEEMKSVREEKRAQLGTLSKRKRAIRDKIKAQKLKALEKRRATVGQVVLQVAENDAGLRRLLQGWLDEHLQKPEEREMFDLPAKEETA